MKIILIFILALLSLNCQENNKEKIRYPEGDKILYSEFTGFESQRIVLYSIDEQKEYEIPVDFFNRFPEEAIFSPDGNKILIKGPDYIDDIHIFDLETSKWEKKIIPALNQPGEGSYYNFDYLNDDIIAVIGSNHCMIISLKTTNLINRITFKDSLYISSLEVSRTNNQICFSCYSLDDLMNNFNNLKYHLLIYDYAKKEFIKSFSDTGILYQWIEDTNNLFMHDSVAIKFNIESGKKIPLNIEEEIGQNRILYPQSRFITENNLMLLISGNIGSNKEGDRDFYLYNFKDNSLNQVTDTKTRKTLMDVYINNE